MVNRRLFKIQSLGGISNHEVRPSVLLLYPNLRVYILSIKNDDTAIYHFAVIFLCKFYSLVTYASFLSLIFRSFQGLKHYLGHSN
jgi:hypothetical protein